LAHNAGGSTFRSSDTQKTLFWFKDSSTIAIVDVDCTAGGEQTCQKYGVRGYPTLQYFTAQTKGGAYNQARDFASMKSFVSEKLQVCNAKTLAGCAPNQVEVIKKNKDMSTEDLQALKKEKESVLKDICDTSPSV